jgi:predicted nucleic acid-binding protein
MKNIIVSDTGPLIALSLLKLLPTLPDMFSQIYVPSGVIEEALKDPAKPGAIDIQEAVDSGCLTVCDVSLEGVYLELIKLLDQGESEALALANDLCAVVLIDERRGRQVAKKYQIPITGTAALLIKAKKQGLISEVKPLILELQKFGYRLGAPLVLKILRICNEEN